MYPYRKSKKTNNKKYFFAAIGISGIITVSGFAFQGYQNQDSNVTIITGTTDITKDVEKISKEQVIKKLSDKKDLNFQKIPDLPQYIIEAMFRIWERKGGTYSYVPFCIAGYESKFDPTCWNQKGEDSRGLFQVNVADPAHAKRNPNRTKLFDPAYNMNYQFEELVQFEKEAISKGLCGVEIVRYVAKYGQRPRWTKDIERKIDLYYSLYLNAKEG